MYGPVQGVRAIPRLVVNNAINFMAAARAWRMLGMHVFKNKSIAWDTTRWEAVESRTVDIPYFDGNRRKMPVVLLRHRKTGQEAYFANFHNPASNSRRGNNDGHRWRAMMLEIDLANRLWNETGYPVFITGDMNEREVYFCNMTGRAPMIAANGGSNEGSCSPPPYPMPLSPRRNVGRSSKILRYETG